MSQTNISGITDMTQGGRPGDDAADGALHGRGGHGKEKKIGHRRVTHEGTVTYKKKSTSELQRAIQLGIEHSVGQMLPQRDLLLRDFGVVETVDFPSTGSKLTPAHSLSDFKFKTYAPYAFRFFRALFDVDMSEFLRSLCLKELRELSNPGASGSIFYITQDDEFIIKTVQHKEGAFLQKLLPEYYMNLTQNKYTLLPKFYGLYCYQCGGKNIRFVVMNNLLPSSIPIHEKYDLKGSTLKRSASSKERAKTSPTLKDLDFRELNPEGIQIEEFDALKKTIERDCRVMESFRIMDYSLLLGIHNLDRAKADAAADSSTKDGAVSASMPETIGGGYVAAAASSSYSGNSAGGGGGADGGGGAPSGPLPTRGRSIKRIAANTTAMEALQGAGTGLASTEVGVTGTGTLGPADDVPEDMPPGGVPARNQRGERLLLFIGIIDILQSYRLLKKMEHTMKSIVHESDSISVHNPAFYATRFQSFLLEHVFHKMPLLENSRFRKIAQAAIKHGPSRKKGSRSRANTKETDHTDSDDRPHDQSRKVSIVSTVSDTTDSHFHQPAPASHLVRPRRVSATACYNTGSATARDSLLEAQTEESGDAKAPEAAQKKAKEEEKKEEEKKEEEEEEEEEKIEATYL